MIQEQDWTEAYKELCPLINTDVPEIKHIDLWFEQIDYAEEEYPFPAQSLFMDFDCDDTQTIGEGVQDINCVITFYHAFDTLSETYHGSTNQQIALEFMAVQKKLHKLLQGLSGVSFSPMDRVGNKRYPTKHGYLNVREMAYKCIIRDYSAKKEYIDVTVTGIGVDNSVDPNTAIWTDMYTIPEDPTN